MTRNPYGMSQSELCDYVEMYGDACKEILALKTRIAELEQVSAAGVKDAERIEYLYQTTAVKPFIAPITTKGKWVAHIDEQIDLAKGVQS